MNMSSLLENDTDSPPKGVACDRASGIAESKEHQERLGHLLAVMKKHVKGRQKPDVVELRTLAEPAFTMANNTTLHWLC
jgi:hypothetical protein